MTTGRINQVAAFLTHQRLTLGGSPPQTPLGASRVNRSKGCEQSRR